MHTIHYAAILTLAVFSMGCRQTANPNMPLAPINPLGGPTRVPPPATGSYATPGGYYQGQAANTGGTTLGDLSQFAENSTVTALPASGMNAAPHFSSATNSGYVGNSTYASDSAYTGDSAGAGNRPGYGVVAAAGWSSSNPGAARVNVSSNDGSGAFRSVQPVAHMGESGQSQRSDFVTLVTPRIPDTARQAIDAAAGDMRPILRGMEVVDLSRSSALRPAEQPQLASPHATRDIPSTTPAVADATDAEALPWRTPFR
ncbi:hypothetical protein SH139x_003828 [Planctomycetaceae bacterium SH139]